MIQVVVNRYQKEKGSFDQEYQVTMPEGERWCVLNLLEWIVENQDPTLAFFRHACCRQAACGGCVVRINGKIGLACKEEVLDGTTIKLGPAGKKVVRDLICE